ncbi:MAG: acetyl-CoA carboxylase biotin carboxyl carrier protein [Balneolaceae bacterium]
MDLELVKNLLNLISESDVNEVSIEEGDFKIKIKKKSDTEAPSTIHYQLPSQGQPTHSASNVQPEGDSPHPETISADSKSGGQDKDSSKAESEELRSPIVGTFYRAASPDSDPFVEVGDRIEKGDTICIVEAMKIMNEIEAEFSGVVQEILVEEAQPVEFDQPLFLIKKD